MGIRMDQHMGLTEWARKFVKDKPIEKSGEFYPGMLDGEYPLHKYTFPDGRVYFEGLQASPWSSGPIFFLALQDENGKWIPESLWTEEAIKAAL